MMKECFVHPACYDARCPNISYDMADDKWGGGIADDMGLEKIKCKDCAYNLGECKDCSFLNTEYCIEALSKRKEK